MLPMRRVSKSQTHRRRAHHRLKPVNYSHCSKCGQAKLPHAACANCGYVNPNMTLKLSKEESS
jgi:large subunit ribosomal protein L32